jgi:hypothetical protein
LLSSKATLSFFSRITSFSSDNLTQLRALFPWSWLSELGRRIEGLGQEEGGRGEFRDMYLDSESEENNILRWSNITWDYGWPHPDTSLSLC